MHTAKVFISGNSQAVRLPKEFTFLEQEIYIQKVGNTVILFPIDDPWAVMKESLNEFSDDFLESGKNQPQQLKKESF